MKAVARVLAAFDMFQQKHPVVGFPLAVFMKFGDDQAGNQAALLTYYGFVSLFPLLLVGFSILPWLLQHDLALQERVIKALLDYFPVVGADLAQNIHTYKAHGFGLVAGLLFVFYGTRGVANALQEVSNTVWQIPKAERPGFPLNLARSLSIILVGGVGFVITTAILGFVTGISQGSVIGKIMLGVVVFSLNTGVILLVNRFATAKLIPIKDLVLGSALAALFLQVLQMAGSFLLLHQMKGTSALYGTFAIVLGLLFWLYLQAELYIYALQINVVRRNKLWPRSLTSPLAKPDKKVYAGYAQTEKRKKEESIAVTFKKKPTKQ